MSGRIALLTHGSRSAQALAHALHRSGLDLALILTEAEPVPPKAKGLGWLLRSTLGDPTVNRMNVWRSPRKLRVVLSVEKVLRESAELELEASLQNMGIAHGWPQVVQREEVGSVNDHRAVELVRAARPDLLAVFGTGVLRGDILGTTLQGAVNAHSSLLPNYRGSRAEFWQCYHDDRECIGITIHRIDRGVDTGDILFQAPTDSIWPTDPYSLRRLNTLSVIQHYPHVIQEHLAGRIIPKPQGQGRTPTYRNRDVTIERRMALFGRFAL